MKGENVKKQIITAIKVIISVIICAAGVEFIVMSDFGLDPLTGLESALSKRIGITLGQASLLFEGTTFLIFLFVNKKLLGFGSFAFCFGMGPCIDAWTSVLRMLNVGEKSGAIQILYLLIGSLLIILSIAYYVPLNFGLQSLDMYSVSTASILHKSYGTGLTIVYICMICASMILGVYPGLATIAAIFLYGWLIDRTRELFHWKMKE